jgi:hypothetical protein
MITAVPEEQAAAFALVRRSQIPTDLLPEDRWGRYQEGRVGQLGLNPALARRAETPLGNVWVIPGDGWICLSLAASPGPSSLDGGGLTCNRTVRAIAGRMITWGSCGSAVIVQGLVPNDVPEVTLTTATGSVQTVSVSDNTYGVILRSALAAVHIGSETVLRLGVPDR